MENRNIPTRQQNRPIQRTSTSQNISHNQPRPQNSVPRTQQSASNPARKPMARDYESVLQQSAGQQYSRVHRDASQRTPAQNQRIREIEKQKNENTPLKPPSKNLIVFLTILLAGLISLNVAISISQQNSNTSNSDNIPASSASANNDKPSSSPNYITPEAGEGRILELDEINPTYEFITWKGKQQLTIDDDSMKQIVQLALRDAVDFYYDLEAPNCTFTLENGKLKNTTGKENFIEKQMNWEYYMGRIYQEASGYIMIDFVNDIGRGADNPNGVFGSMPLTTNDTLDEYFGLIFKENTDFSKLDSVLTKQDVTNVNSSKEANKIITEKVYNATLKVVIDDIHKLKSMTIGHDECYLPYKNMTPEQIMVAYNIHPSLKDEVVAICKELKEYNGLYSPTLALAAINATHLNGFTDVRSSMSDGSFFKKYFNSEYIQKTFGNTDKIEESGLFYQ